jgi:hypothetical protein
LPVRQAQDPDLAEGLVALVDCATREAVNKPRPYQTVEDRDVDSSIDEA